MRKGEGNKGKGVWVLVGSCLTGGFHPKPRSDRTLTVFSW